MVEPLTDDVASDAETNYSRITPVNFTLKKNASDTTTNVDWPTCSAVVNELLVARDKHLCALDNVHEANRVYKPGV
ncbi:hypothetical protein ColTof4_01220 [Colletotrichum tofieldiae]|uniref:Uncharacterized protein n=1 Tax=Colletotrichum tofieldiae TaxID=708197 RepID=A0A166SBG6_9PEZI|nr:hypothetical protein CT0861_01879 [Colletotrichum tofieldiae]GKT68797.1 hypothetical protein ColTof4_01220 [Colletotrichum tofieldiae]